MLNPVNFYRSILMDEEEEESLERFGRPKSPFHFIEDLKYFVYGQEFVEEGNINSGT